MLATPVQSSADILGVVVTLNKNEIAAAREAKRKAVNPAVKRYANMLYTQHTKNLQKTINLSRKLGVTPATNNLTMMLQNKGQQEMATLASLNGRDFDRAYINDMVTDHTEALQLLDQILLKRSLGLLLTKHLKSTRDHIAMHLHKAERIQAQLMGS